MSQKGKFIVDNRSNISNSRAVKLASYAMRTIDGEGVAVYRHEGDTEDLVVSAVENEKSTRYVVTEQ